MPTTITNNYKALPTLLKALLWLNAAGILVTIAGLCHYRMQPWQILFHVSWIFLNIFITIGVLQRQESIRRLIVFFGWLLIMMYALVLIARTSVMLELNIIYSAVFVWGFSTAVAKQYFKTVQA